MRPIHLFVSACTACVLGAVTGLSIGTTPLERGLDAWDSIPRPGPDTAYDDERYPEGLPDHYPIVTPQGRFEVGELRNRGLYRNRRFAMASWWDAADEPAYAVAPAGLSYVPAAEATPTPPPRRAPPKPPGADKPVVLAAAESEALAPPPVELPPALAGGARTLGVAAELASRR